MRHLIVRASGFALLIATVLASSAAHAAPPEPTWARLGDGPDRAFHSMVYDPGNDYYWVFGGLSEDVEENAFQNTVFERSAADDTSPWFVAPIPGLRPPDLAFHTAVYDPVRRRMLVAGGLLDRRDFEFAEPIAGESIWWLDLVERANARWSNRIVPGNSTKRFGHAAVYVPDFDAMIISGGFSTFSEARSDNFALLLGEDPMRWMKLPEDGLSARGGHALIWDEAAKRLLAFGGATNLESLARLDDVLALDLSDGLDSTTGWVTLTTTSASAPVSSELGRAFVAHGFDPLERLWWIHGGARSQTEIVREVDVLDLSAGDPEWTRTEATGDGPLERFGHGYAWDADRRRLIVQGGSPDNVGTLRDTRALAIPESPSTPSSTATPDSTPTESSPTTTATTTGSSPTATSTSSPTGSATASTATESPTLGPSETGTPTPTVLPSATREDGTEIVPTPEFRSVIHLPWVARNAGG